MKAKKEKTFSVNPARIETSQIKASAWNTHVAEKADDESIRGLMESIRENGMIHRVLIRVADRGSAKYRGNFEIIDGHRRFAAAVALGWNEIPCEIVDCSDDEAQAMMLTANIQRMDNDPILEAECIRAMSEGGLTYGKIAAKIGRSEGFVARRARLCNLTEKWKGWLVRVDAGVSLMEFVASHEQKLQDECFENLGVEDDGLLDEDDIINEFKNRLRKLGDCEGFDCGKAGCKDCPYNTANHGLLFADEEKYLDGLCENEECFIRNWNDETDGEIERLRGKGFNVIEVKSKWDAPNGWNGSQTWTSCKTQPYVYTSNELKCIVWVEPKAEVKAEQPALTEEEKAEALRKRKAHKVWDKNRKAAYDKIRKAFAGKDISAWYLAGCVTTNESWLKNEQKRISDTFFIGYPSDCFCQGVLEFVGDCDLRRLAGADLTKEERQAVMEKDPAEVALAGSSQDEDGVERDEEGEEK